MSDMQASKGRQQVAGAPGHAFPFLKAGMRVSAPGRGGPSSHHCCPTHPTHPTNPHAEPRRDPSVWADTKRPQPLHQRCREGDRGEHRRLEGWLLGAFLLFPRELQGRAASPLAPISSLHLHSSGSQSFWQAFLAAFLLVSAKPPLSEGWRASIVKRKERKQIKNQKNASHPPTSAAALPSIPPMAAGGLTPPSPLSPCHRSPQTGSDHSIQAPTVPVWL